MDNSVLIYNTRTLVARDTALWIEVYQEYTPLIQRTLLRECTAAIMATGQSVPHVIEELCQDVWLALWVSLKSGAIKSLEPGIVVTRTKQIAQNARERQFNEVDVDILPLNYALGVQAESTPEADYFFKEALDRVFAQMESEDRALFDMRIHEGLSYSRIAQETGDSVFALKMRMVRIRKKLKKELGIEIQLPDGELL